MKNNPGKATGAEDRIQDQQKVPLLSQPPGQVQNRRCECVRAVFELLEHQWPLCFSIYERRRRPLKIGIHLEIIAALDGAITPAELSNALRAYVANPWYLKNVRVNAVRVDLDGNPAGIISKSEAEFAKNKLILIRSLAVKAEFEARDALANAGRRIRINVDN